MSFHRKCLKRKTELSAVSHRMCEDVSKTYLNVKLAEWKGWICPLELSKKLFGTRRKYFDCAQAFFFGQWLWLSWLSGRFRYRRSAVRIWFEIYC